jgi:hypothetical protein
VGPVEMLGRMCLQAGWVSEECVNACSTHPQVVRYYEMSRKGVMAYWFMRFDSATR